MSDSNVVTVNFKQICICFYFNYEYLLFKSHFLLHTVFVYYKTDSHRWDVTVDILLMSVKKWQNLELEFLNSNSKYAIIYKFLHKMGH